ncbi:MAG: methionine synthase [Promethearchaeota archaeon]|nr:MAG: methionine synthase [Candidatus Lokiarchaeota archaeon]
MKAESNSLRTLKKKKVILTANIGQCVHVAGTFNFMNIATNLGYKCIFLGPAVPISEIIKNIKKYNPHILGLSYRLTPKTVKPLLERFLAKYNQLDKKPKRIFFSGTPAVVQEAKKCDIFDAYFVGGESRFKIISILREDDRGHSGRSKIPMDLISRIEWKKPYPIIRAHFGLDSFEKTRKGIEQIAEAEVLDVISIAPDQNSQENYFHPEDQNKDLAGAGGVPLRSRKDFIDLHKARLRGNYPLLRIYAGTRDFIDLAKLYKDTIQNAWAAIPIFWFNQMDGRGPLSLKDSIKQHLEAMQWHAEQKIPVEINDSHHWSLRNASDSIAVADMYLSGIIAKKLGIEHFVAQYMFNTPPSSSFEMDLAKMLAKNELLHSLADNSFHIIKQVRTGLASFPLNLNKAKGQLAAATLIQLAIKPDIVHVVSFSEAKHAAQPEDIIESCEIVEQVINRIYSSNLSLNSEVIAKRKEKLKEEAKWIINLIPNLATNYEERKNPYVNHKVLTKMVKYGIFDAPHLKNNPYAPGKIQTKMVNGACYSWEELRQKPISDIERIKTIMNSFPEEILKQMEKDLEISNRTAEVSNL